MTMVRSKKKLEKNAEHRIKKTNAMLSQLIGIASKAYLPLDYCQT